MACSGAITSLVMTAAGSFISNGGLSEVFGGAPIQGAQGLTDSFNELGGQTWFDELSTTVSDFGSSVIEFTQDMKDAWNFSQTSLSDGVTSMLGNFAPNAANALAPTVLQGTQMAFNYGLNWATQTVGGTNPVAGAMIGDAMRYGSVVSAAQAYVGTVNQVVGAATNAGNYLSDTFKGMDNLVTGGFDGVSKWTQGLGDDISNLGNTISWEKLENLGSPGQLMENISVSGTLGPLADKITNITLSPDTVKQLGGSLLTAERLILSGQPVTLQAVGLDPVQVISRGAGMPTALQTDIYKVLQNTTGTELAQVQQILGNKQTNLVTAADLLDPKKILPKSYMTLTTPVRTASVGFRGIYENESGSVNPQLDKLGDDLKGIIPDDQAVANAALSRSLLQVKNIAKSNTTSLTETLLSLENNRDLPLIQDQTSVLPPGVAEYWQSQYGDLDGIALGTGSAGQYKLSDVIGFASGFNSTDAYAQTAAVAGQLESAGAFYNFTNDDGASDPNTGIYKVIQYFLAGTYGPAEDPMSPGNWYVTIPVGVKGEGIYGPFPTEDEAFEDAWINGVVPAAVVECQNLYAAYPTECDQLNTLNAQFTEQIAREYTNQQRIRNTTGLVVFSDIPKTNQTAIQMALSLHQYGQDTTEGGAAACLEAVANLNSLGGQAMVATMREGRNIARLEAGGVGIDTSLPTFLPEGQAELIPAKYTKDEAEELVIRS